MRRWLGVSVLAAQLLSIGLVGTAHAQEEPSPEAATIVINVPTDPQITGIELLHAEKALLTRLPDRIRVEVWLETPQPGKYRYALSVPPEQWAAPEVFTGWLFVFNRPEHCVSSPTPPRCGPEDFSKKARGGAYNVGAHVSSISHHGGAFVLDEGTDGHVVISGEVLVGSDPLSATPPDPAIRTGLQDPMGAEVHLAIVSHGQLDPSTLPGELYEAEGVPDCDCWWLAVWIPAESPG